MPSRPADAFLDPIGVGTAAVLPARPGMISWASVVVAAAPVVAMLTALTIVALTGLSRRSNLPPAVEPWIYGFFLDRYPLFAFALVYGAARIVAVASGPGPASAPRRVVVCLLGVVALAAGSLYPTVGGLVLRGGFATGGMAFLTGQTLMAAYALGTFVAAAAFGGIVGASALAANRPLRLRLTRVGTAGLAVLALWFGAVVIGLGRDAGVGPWPGRGFEGGEAILAAGLLLIAALPHAAATILSADRAA